MKQTKNAYREQRSLEVLTNSLAILREYEKKKNDWAKGCRSIKEVSRYSTVLCLAGGNREEIEQDKTGGDGKQQITNMVWWRLGWDQKMVFQGLPIANALSEHHVLRMSIVS